MVALTIIIYVLCLIVASAPSIGYLTGFPVTGFVIAGIAAVVSITLCIHLARKY